MCVSLFLLWFDLLRLLNSANLPSFEKTLFHTPIHDVICSPNSEMNAGVYGFKFVSSR